VPDYLTRNEPGAPDVQITVVFGETQPGGKYLPHRAVTVQHRDDATALFEFDLKGFGDRGLPGGR
jgi:hypothetical protein